MIKANLSNADYHAITDHVSNSMLTKVGQSPKTFKNWLNSENNPPTKAMLTGSVFHTLTLEPENYQEEYIVKEKVDGRTKAGIEYKEAFPKLSHGKTVIEPASYEAATAMQYAIENHSLAKSILAKPGRVELSFFGTDPETGVQTKWRIDKLTDCGYLIDLKSTKDASKEQFAKSIANFNYHSQAAYYMDNTRYEGIEVKGFVFIVVENTNPFRVAVYVPDNDMIEEGRSVYRKNLDLYARCMESGKWPGLGYNYESGTYKPQEISLPGWAYQKD